MQTDNFELSVRLETGTFKYHVEWLHPFKGFFKYENVSGPMLSTLIKEYRHQVRQYHRQTT